MALTIFIVVLSIAILSYPLLQLSKPFTTASTNSSSLCQLRTNLHEFNQTCDSSENHSHQNNSRVIVIGDIHGSFSGLLAILHQAGITPAPYTCEWDHIDKYQNPVTIIQIGDIVDRGPGASEAWECLSKLQATQGDGNRVIRMIGSRLF